MGITGEMMGILESLRSPCGSTHRGKTIGDGRYWQSMSVHAWILAERRKAADKIERLTVQRDAYETQGIAEGRIVHKCNAEIERLRKLNKLTRPDDQYADYNFNATKVRHECVDRDKQGDFEACHRDRRDLILEIERLRAALEEIADKAIAYEDGGKFSVDIARKALKQSEKELT